MTDEASPRGSTPPMLEKAVDIDLTPALDARICRLASLIGITPVEYIKTALWRATAEDIKAIGPMDELRNMHAKTPPAP